MTAPPPLLSLTPRERPHSAAHICIMPLWSICPAVRPRQGDSLPLPEALTSASATPPSCAVELAAVSHTAGPLTLLVDRGPLEGLTCYLLSTPLRLHGGWTRLADAGDAWVNRIWPWPFGSSGHWSAAHVAYVEGLLASEVSRASIDARWPVRAILEHQLAHAVACHRSRPARYMLGRDGTSQRLLR